MEISINSTLKRKVNTTLILVLTLLCCKTINTKQPYNDSYKNKAIELIILSENSEKYSIQKNDIRVSEELIPFHDIGMFFLDSLLAEGFSKLEFGDLNNFTNKVDITLKELTTNSNSNVHIFYSNEIKDFFFIEVIIDDRKQLKYEEVTQGDSVGYMFKKYGDSVTLEGKIRIHHG